MFILLSLFIPLVMPRYALEVITTRQINKIINSRAKDEDIPRNVATISAINGNDRPNPTPAPARIPKIKNISRINASNILQKLDCKQELDNIYNILPEVAQFELQELGMHNYIGYSDKFA